MSLQAMSRTLGFPGNRLGAGEESHAPARTGGDGEPMGREPDGGVQRRGVRDRGHAAGARPARARVGDERPVARHRAPVAELPGLRHKLHHDRRHLAGPPRHLPPPQVREHPGDAAEPAAPDDRFVPPFPTGLAAQAVRDENAERVAVIFYGASLLMVSVALAALWRSVVRDPKLLRPEVTEQEIRAITNRSTPNIGLYVGATVLALFAPNAAAGFYLVIALVTVARARGDTPAPEPEASRAA